MINRLRRKIRPQKFLKLNVSTTGGCRWVLSPPSLKYKLIYISSQRHSGNRTSEDAMTFFFNLHLILGGKLDVERREDLFFWSSLIFSVETETGNLPLPPLLKFPGTSLCNQAV